MRAVGVIPARLASTRLPDKPLAMVGGLPLIRHVVENARRCRSLDEILVATDAESIAEAVREAGVEAVLTDPELPSGTDRIAAALQGREFDLAVNIQGDEPEIAPEAIDSVVALMKNDPSVDLGTAAAPIRDLDEFQSPHRVKVVLASDGTALYFSRSPIPFHRADAGGVALSPQSGEWGLGHVGLYAFRRDALFAFIRLNPSSLEQAERLEQLRALQAGMKIGVVRIDAAPPGIDTPEDLSAFAYRLEQHRNDSSR